MARAHAEFNKVHEMAEIPDELLSNSGEHEGAIPDKLPSNSGGCVVCLGQCVQENHFMSLSDPAACSKCAAQECRSVCDEEHGKDGVQRYIDVGCSSDGDE